MKFLAFYLFFAIGSAHAASFTVDPNHSTVGFEAKHLVISSIPGRFREFSGAIDLNEKDFAKSKVDFTVKAASIDTGVDKRDEHLRTEDFFAADKFPEAKFVTSSIRRVGKNRYKAEGDLTIRGVTKKAQFQVDQVGKVEDPMMKIEKTVFRATGEINRRDFGINYGPDAIVSDRIKLFINLETHGVQK